MLFLAAVWELNPLVRWLWPIPVVGFVVYPYLKRFTWLCHLWLGAVDGLADDPVREIFQGEKDHIFFDSRDERMRCIGRNVNESARGRENGNTVHGTLERALDARAVVDVRRVRIACLVGVGVVTAVCCDPADQVAFDGQRILVTNSSGNSVSLWKAADLTPLGSFSTGASTGPFGACSDGINFWITLRTTNRLARF